MVMDTAWGVVALTVPGAEAGDVSSLDTPRVGGYHHDRVLETTSDGIHPCHLLLRASLFSVVRGPTVI